MDKAFFGEAYSPFCPDVVSLCAYATHSLHVGLQVKHGCRCE